MMLLLLLLLLVDGFVITSTRPHTVEKRKKEIKKEGRKK
jgi:hypothetical protein